jgi:hypothetical protein
MVGIITRGSSDPAELITGAHPYTSVGLSYARACRYFLLAIVP